MKGLKQYLRQLNSSETQWGIWVNPSDPDEYRIGHYCFENGGILDDWSHIGSLNSLSFGFQSESEAIDEICYGGVYDYNGKTIHLNVDAIKKSFFEGDLDPEFEVALESDIELICQNWADQEANLFVDIRLPEILEEAKKNTYENALSA